jgi:hypothetical protein
MSHGVSIKMIVESFNATLPPLFRNLFKPTASVLPPPQTPFFASRPATAATSSAAAAAEDATEADMSLVSPREVADAVDWQQMPTTTRTRPSTSYSDAGGAVSYLATVAR